MKTTGALSILLFLSTICSAQFTITGNPELITGATWTYHATINSITYDLKGILFKPSGAGPFPAVIINHGTGGNINSYSKEVAKKMVEWGYVCIATNYTHAGGAACGAPGNCCDPALCGTSSDWGASTSNILRGKKCYDLLTTLNYVDTNCVMAFGHSRGAFVTTALVATYPTKFKAAGHSAGGVTTLTNTLAPTATLAANITCPYIMHHGDIDNTVSLSMDNLLEDVFIGTGTIHQLLVYPGYSHSAIALDSAMFAQTKEWFSAYGCSSSLPVKLISFSGTRNENQCYLQWKSENTNEVLYYELERCIEPHTKFEMVSKIETRNSCSFTCEFNYTDILSISLPVSKIYYRLKIHTLEGNIEYSPIITINLNEDNTLKLFPNPRAGNQDWAVENTKTKIESISVLNMEGKIIYEINNLQGLFYTMPYDLFNRGVYIFKVSTEDNKIYYLRGVSFH